MKIYMLVVKAGRLANGAERGRGTVVHLSETVYYGPALCGDKPKISWSESSYGIVTCKKCVKLFKVLNEKTDKDTKETIC